MRFVRLLPERWQRLLREVLKFGAVGGVNAVINYAVFNALALTVFADGQLKANVIATVVAACSSYLLNRHWTYRDRPKSAMRREYFLFFVFNATGLAIELGVLAIAKYGLGISGLLALNVAKTVGVGLATIFRFWSYRTFVFRSAPEDLSDPASNGAVRKTTSGPHPDGEFLAGLDPVAELAEAVTELTEADDDHDRDRKAATGNAVAETRQPTDARQPTADHQPTGTGQSLEVQFAETIDVALETELAAELNAAPRRSSAR
ncbi:GtrA family protein [Plantactinospora soyae]|uniref:Flippase GtrA n=1 Tax=Plantactinospora soyae TaxID=1544732 RepID=A0A927M2S4_9ACTN|nr:GtrA family protein [Plantactinospora soyae]MBE1487012.1 putative flippase GtrA [Plantactinospora soyae]